MLGSAFELGGAIGSSFGGFIVDTNSGKMVLSAALVIVSSVSDHWNPRSSVQSLDECVIDSNCIDCASVVFSTLDSPKSPPFLIFFGLRLKQSAMVNLALAATTSISVMVMLKFVNGVATAFGW